MYKLIKAVVARLLLAHLLTFAFEVNDQIPRTLDLLLIFFVTLASPTLGLILNSIFYHIVWLFQEVYYIFFLYQYSVVLFLKYIEMDLIFFKIPSHNLAIYFTTSDPSYSKSKVFVTNFGAESKLLENFAAICCSMLKSSYVTNESSVSKSCLDFIFALH